MVLTTAPELFAANTKRTNLTGEVVIVIVGENEKRFAVHEAPLRANSAFFSAALGGNWKESADRVVRFPDEDEDYFHIYVQWLYRGIYLKKQGGASFTLHDLACLYTMGSRLQDHDFQDALIDFILRRWEVVRLKPKNDTIHLVYQNTTSKNPLRGLFIDICARASLAPFQTNAGEPMAEFYYELAKAALGGIGGSKQDVITEVRQTCRYHQHGDRPCYGADRT